MPKSARPVVAAEHRLMMQAIVQSWACNDPNAQNGAILYSDHMMFGAYGTLIGNDHTQDKPKWEESNVYDYFIPAEINVLKLVNGVKLNYETVLYVTTIPHPDNVKILLDREIRKIIYLPVKPPYVPNNYRKKFDRMANFYHNVKIEQYKFNLYWVYDRLDIMKLQREELFG